ncbi:MAG: hypothetical protein K2H99_07050 [Paramuribaculum sp.]|nr:hypothetical protein [Paramuribaculum sp.]MDE5921512.1 hypothetical protein [Paramuribaculum sp.]
MNKINKRIFVYALVMLAMMYSSCRRVDSDSITQVSSSSDTITMSLSPRPLIGGHVGQDTIIGNFTGKGLDSIWVVERIDTVINGYVEYNYHTKSNNPLLPSVELYGHPSHCAFIANEGDVDGDGKDEWAWMRGSFRSYAEIEYHLLHFDGQKWLECSFGFERDTRHSGLDVVRRGPVENSIIISILYWSEEDSSGKVMGCDTIVNPFRDNPILSDNGDE